MKRLIVAVDIGNSRIKLGLFRESPKMESTGTESPGTELPTPDATCELRSDDGALLRIEQWLAAADVRDASWWIGSVNRPASIRLRQWLTQRRHDLALLSEPVFLTAKNLPLTIDLPEPDRVGIDRLLDALAANELRRPKHPAIVVDLGTAITVNRISADGRFEGGAILPGIGLSARALHEFTDQLPLLDFEGLAEPPLALGKNTRDAMTSGLYWGALGGIRELIIRLGKSDRWASDIFLTGGAAPIVAPLLSGSARYVPHLTLSAIALVAQRGSVQ